MSLEIINPLEHPEWNELLLTSEKSSFFHTSNWARVLYDSYNYKPLYFTQIENNRLKVLIPVMEISSFLTGKRGISLPFTDSCQPISENESQFNAATQELIEYGKKAGWMSLELRGGIKYLDESFASETFISDTLNLEKGKEDVFKDLRDSTRRNIKHARLENVRVTLDNSRSSVETFYKLHCITRKIHGLPPQPVFFFRKVIEHIISRGKGFVSLALWKDKPCGRRGVLSFRKKGNF